MYDMTLPMTGAALAEQNIPGLIEPRVSDVGGLDDYLKIIETEVKPRVAAVAKVDIGNQAFFGHSLGGLAVLRALFTEPTAFRTFIVASPSIWWTSRAVLAGEPAFRSGKVRPRVLVTVGSEEQDSSKVSRAVAALIGGPEKVEASTQKSRMVDNACELAERLKADCVVFPQQSHGISPWPALARGIAFAFPVER
jgi:predicted alpha/beta superfamily hydrolase